MLCSSWHPRCRHNLSSEVAYRGGQTHGATATVSLIKSMVMGSWPGSESGIPDSDGSWKPRELPEEEGDVVRWWPRKRVMTRGWKRVCLWSSPSEMMRLGDTDFSPSSPQRHALLLLLAGL